MNSTLKNPNRASPPQLFRAFGDPTRLRLLRLLVGGECCVCHLVAALKTPQPTASRHLAYLRREGLVEVRKQGLWCYYRLAAPTSRLHEKLIECLACCFDESPAFVRDAARLAAERGDGCK